MNIDDLKSVIGARGGLAQTNRFEIQVTPPTGLGIATRDFSVLCESCSLPGRQITTIDYQILQQSYKIPSGFINEDVTFTFLLTNDFYVKKAFEAWANAVVDFNSYKVKYLDNYAGEITIRQLTKGVYVPPPDIATGDTLKRDVVNPTEFLPIPKSDDDDTYNSKINLRTAESLEQTVIYEAVLHNAFPISIGSLSLDNSSENTIQKLTVTVAYENFENITK
jgi:hypothetical protein